MLLKCCTQRVHKSGRPSSGYRTGKGQSSSQFPRRAILKSFQTIEQLHSFPMLVRSCLKSCMLGFSTVWTKNFQMSKLSLERGTRNQIANFSRIIEKAREFQKASTSASLMMPKLLIVWIVINCGKLLEGMGIPDRLTCLLRNLYAGQEAMIRTLYGTTAEEAMAPHSSALAWKIPWTEESGGLQSMGSLRVGHD